SLESYETDRSVSGNMMTWLESDLATNTQPWVIAFWHHPPYTKGSHDSDTEGQLIDMRENALPILEAWGVDLVLSGHSHSYERSYLIDGHYGTSGTLDPVDNVLDPGDGWDLGDGAYQKPDSLAAANAGAVYAVAGSSGKVSGGSLDHPAMFVSLSSLGSMVIDVTGGQMEVVFIDETGAVEDIFNIRKAPDTDPPLLSGATAEDASHVLVDFSEAVDPLEAENAANYSIAGLVISDATLQPNQRSVRLTTTAMLPEQTYTLFVSNVEDVAGNPIAANSQTDYTFFEYMTVVFQDGLLPDPSYFATQDAYIREASPDTQHGTESEIQIDGDEPSGQSLDMYGMIQWDISSIPVDAIVESAQIVIDVTNVASSPYECFSLLRAWDETSVTWNESSAGQAWASPGAVASQDRGSDVVCSVNATSLGALTVNLTTDGLALVQSWINTPASNHGIIIADQSNTNGADFHASESAAAMSRPRLEVTYRVPVGSGNQDPVAAFSHACVDLACDFTDLSFDGDGTVVSWSWDFGDGSSSNSPNPSHSFAASGDYTVSLSVTDDQGASDTTMSLISVLAAGTSTVAFQDGVHPDSGYSGTQDGYIREASAATAHGSELTLQMDGSEPSGSVTDMSIVIRWDTSSIPSYATVEDASMVFEVTNPSTSGPYECYALLKDWNQSEVSWNEASNGVNWTGAGATAASDRGSEVVCAVDAASTGSLTVDFNSDGLALIQSWIASPSSNYGI
ncbi:MAG TPA: DNRLRE domain-containing protein, partial [Xanthomonadales bacterium]|nr:DNRLRE domain-containing protein [Xanthomonadales bacterium]